MPSETEQRNARHWSRRLALQALYQWQMTGQSPSEILAQFAEDENMKRADHDYFEELMTRIPAMRESVDARIASQMQRQVSEVDPVERAGLRIACYELMERPDIPCRVIIDEAVGLSRKFGAEQGHRFINGVLDGIARQLRSTEFGQGT